MDAHGELSIRALEENDLDAVTAIHNQLPVILGTLQIPYTSTRRWREHSLADPDSIQLVATRGGAVVGVAGLRLFQRRRAHAAALGMSVHADHHGQGIGTALLRALLDLADNWHNVRRLELEVYTDNEPAVRLYQKHGFEIEGRLRSYAFRNGAYADVYAMARLREDARVQRQHDQPQTSAV